MKRIIFCVLTIQPSSGNKTTKYLDKLGADYKVFVPKCYEDYATGYGERACIYDEEYVKQFVDFMGTNIKNGCSVGRTAVTLWAKNIDNNTIAVVLDDDYGGICCNKPVNTYKSLELLEFVINKIYELSKKTGLVLGGYSGGAIPATKNNIMQIFLVDNKTELKKYNKILNEDVCASISDWHCGRGCFGLGTILRSGAQTAEMKKIDGNTKLIYATDRSYRKSYGSVLVEPKHAKIIVNPVNDRGLWHHKIKWARIKPMIIDEDKYGRL